MTATIRKQKQNRILCELLDREMSSSHSECSHHITLALQTSNQNGQGYIKPFYSVYPLYLLFKNYLADYCMYVGTEFLVVF